MEVAEGKFGFESGDSRHFIFEDEGVQVRPEDQEAFDSLTSECSWLYLAIGGILAAAIGISDPLRPEAKEMTELLVLNLVRKGMVTKQVLLTIGYDRESLKTAVPGKGIKDTIYQVVKTGKVYSGTVTADHYGRAHPKYAHGTGNIDRWTSSTKRLMAAMLDIYDRVVDPDLLIRRVNVVAANLIRETEIPEEGPEQLDLFTDYGALEAKKAAEREADEKEKRLQRTTLLLQSRYGKNAILKGMNLQEGATTKARNAQIGGHKAE